MAGHEPPTGSEAVKAVLRGIRRTIGAAKQGKAPATADLIGQMVALCPDNMIGKRDRALLCLGFAGAFRRSELCALEVADLTEVPDGLRILIRRSKGDQEGQGQEVAIPRGYKLRPVEAVQTWLAAAEISSGPGVPSSDAGRTGLGRGPGGRQRGADREAVCPPGRAGSCVLRRPQPAQRVPDVGGRERREHLEAHRGQPSQEPRHAARLRAAGRSVQGARWSSVPLTGNMHAIDTDNARWCVTVARVGGLRRLYGVTLKQHDHGHHIQRTDARPAI